MRRTFPLNPRYSPAGKPTPCCSPSETGVGKATIVNPRTVTRKEEVHSHYMGLLGNLGKYIPDLYISVLASENGGDKNNTRV